METTLKLCTVEGCERTLYSRGYCRMHKARWDRGGESNVGGPEMLRDHSPIDERWRNKFVVDPATGCWLWTDGLTQGYGRFQYKLDGVVIRHLAHRYVWEQVVGPIPDELPLDHLCHTADKDCPGGPTCRHRRCVNPDHLEPVSRPVNTARGKSGVNHASKTHCPRNHEYTPENTIVNGSWRRCRICHNEQRRKRQRIAREREQGAVVTETIWRFTVIEHPQGIWRMAR